MQPPFLYEHITYAVLGTSKLEESIHFYQDLMGLELSSHEPGKHAVFRCSDYTTNLVLIQQQEVGLLRIGLKVQSAGDLERALEHFTSLGYPVSNMSAEESALLNLGENFSVTEPNSGVTFDYFNDMTVPAFSFQPTVTKIQRLGHVVLRLPSPQFEATWKNFVTDFGFPASDFVEDKAVWLRCYPNPFHHSLAIVKDEKAGLHHVNFMVTEVDDIGKARNRLTDAGVDIVFGPGRHKPSGSMFLYFTDPCGMTMEFSFGMEEFPVEDAREPRQLANTSKVMDQWGGKPSPRFAKGGDLLKQ